MSKRKKRNKKPVSPKIKTVQAPDSAIPMAAQSDAVREKPAKKPGARARIETKTKGSVGLINRRKVIKLLIGLPVVGAAGAAIHRYDVQNRDLHDLTLIGQGKPVVVQIHDPACSLCRRLMSNTRKALDGNEAVLFKVADVTSTEGEAFRREHHGETVSLILFDANGRKRATIKGVQTAEDLVEQFARL